MASSKTGNLNLKIYLLCKLDFKAKTPAFLSNQICISRFPFREMIQLPFMTEKAKWIIKVIYNENIWEIKLSKVSIDLD